MSEDAFLSGAWQAGTYPIPIQLKEAQKISSLGKNPVYAICIVSKRELYEFRNNIYEFTNNIYEFMNNILMRYDPVEVQARDAGPMEEFGSQLSNSPLARCQNNVSR
jgi:hypothetical protein